LQRFAEFSRSAVIAVAVATLFIAFLWGAYQLADDEWSPASYADRDYECGGTTSKQRYAPTLLLPGKMNGNPVYEVSRPLPDGPPTVVQVRIGDRYRVCGLIGGP
jgi:hypothetical protein